MDDNPELLTFRRFQRRCCSITQVTTRASTVASRLMKRRLRRTRRCLSRTCTTANSTAFTTTLRHVMTPKLRNSRGPGRSNGSTSICDKFVGVALGGHPCCRWLCSKHLAHWLNSHIELSPYISSRLIVNHAE